MLTITPIYVVLSVVLFSTISIYVIRCRGKYEISVGDGGNPAFARIMRGHANFAEYVPLTLIAMVVAELTGAAPLVVHVAGASLIVGRCMHAYCFLLSTHNIFLRVAGVLLSFAAMWIAAGAIAWSILG